MYRVTVHQKKMMSQLAIPAIVLTNILDLIMLRVKYCEVEAFCKYIRPCRTPVAPKNKSHPYSNTTDRCLGIGP